jgi:NAD(P)-dependent dehydrogenase (short-subunit alcohol dehydrogenase family)
MMQHSKDVVTSGRVAVVTGAASGIGFALSQRFAREGMRVVMADVEAAALVEAAEDLTGLGATILPIATDVSKAEQVDALRDKALDAFGAVHLLCNNAGVGGSLDPVWELPRGDWEWVLGVNLWGVINGIRSFVPVLLEQDAAYVINTASLAGVTTGTAGAYSVSKHGVVALSESLYLELQMRGARVGVSVLCPGWVRTRIADSDRNRPATAEPRLEPSPAAHPILDMVRERIERGMEPAQVADKVVDAVRNSRFYVLTHPEMNDEIRRRADEVVSGAQPSIPTL